MWLILGALALLLVYLYTTRNHSYWAKRNVKHERPIPIFGTHYQNIVAQKSITQIADELYNKYPNEKMVGYYRGNAPELIIRDPEIVKQIMSVDFPYFHKRGFNRNFDKEPMLKNLFHMDGDTWKLLRQRLTPAFTSSKLRNMFPLVVRCAEKLQIVAGELAAREAEYDVRELMARFTTEFIGACGFGVEMDSINNENSHFRKVGNYLIKKNFRSLLVIAILDLFPELKSLFSARIDIVDETILSILRTVRKERGGEPSGRHDFVDLLFELEKKGTIVGESIEHPPDQVELELSEELLAAQMFIFFGAGFETSSSVTSFLLHQLAYNPDAQSRVQEEIDRVMIKYDNKLCYDAVSEMELLDKALKEAMRIFPSLGVLNRVCTRKYTIPGTNVELTPGARILIPVQSLQNDPQYWERPEDFWPERFNVPLTNNFTYLPFGDGPRMCVGARLGQMQSLAGLAAVLHRFTFKPGPTSSPKLEVNTFMNILQGVKNGLPLLIQERKKTN